MGRATMADQASAPQSDAANISRRMVQLLREISGRGPTKARTTIGRDHVLVMFGDTLTHGERTLVENGMTDRVEAVRSGFQDVMKQQAIQIVEEQLHRTVVGMMSVNHFDPDLGAEVFALDPSEASFDGLPEEAEFHQ